MSKEFSMAVAGIRPDISGEWPEGTFDGAEAYFADGGECDEVLQIFEPFKHRNITSHQYVETGQTSRSNFDQIKNFPIKKQQLGLQRKGKRDTIDP